MLQTSGDYRCADPRYQTCLGTGIGGGWGVIEKQGKMKLRWFALNVICVLGVTGEKKKKKKTLPLNALLKKNSKPGIKKKNTRKTKHGQIKRDELKCSVEVHHKSCLHDALGGGVGSATIWPKMCVFNLSGYFFVACLPPRSFFTLYNQLSNKIQKASKWCYFSRSVQPNPISQTKWIKRLCKAQICQNLTFLHASTSPFLTFQLNVKLEAKCKCSFQLIGEV